MEVTTYTDRLKKRMPYEGQENWKDERDTDDQIDDVVMGALLTDNRVISGGAVSAGFGLNADYADAIVRVAGTTYAITAGSITLTAAQPGLEQVNWIHINNIGTVTASILPPTGDYIPLALVDTSETAVIRVADLRPVAAPDQGPPVGTIVPWIGGYFAGAGNSGFTSVLGNTIAAANTHLNPTGWHVCDGTELNDSFSSIFGAAGRFLPDLTDDRFIMGDTAAGATGGDNAMAHTHSVPSHSHSVPSHAHATAAHTLTLSEMPAHNHIGDFSIKWYATGSGGWTSRPEVPNSGEYTVNSGTTGGGASHNHGNTEAWSGTSGTWTGTSGDASTMDNRPKFLSCFYIMRVR
ncbi:MAG: hypothetical protein KJ804_06650 [Proteobacteria bacterium]|nr:hypothetical protein [Pseudomonadota bacterium]MBU1057981.1 hypothetical protein [Pseudomonadota bacterium]